MLSVTDQPIPSNCPKVLPEQRPTELVLGEPCCGQGGLIGRVALLIHLCQWRDHKYPAQEADQRKRGRDCAGEGRYPERGVVTAAERRRQEQDRHNQDGVRPRGPALNQVHTQTGATIREPRASTTSAGSRSMSGQSNVADRMVARGGLSLERQSARARR